MVTSIITTKGQVVIPSRIRNKYGMKKGTKVAFVEKGNAVLMQPLDGNYFESLAGSLGTDGKMLKSLMEDKKREREL
jgi:AbrB family looped-hinge helix DNA binding protein